MTITQVNGFQCRNCTDIDYAKKHIDPAHPKDGPYGVNAKNDPLRPDKTDSGSAVKFDGLLKSLDERQSLADVQQRRDVARTGQRFDLTA